MIRKLKLKDKENQAKLYNGYAELQRSKNSTETN